MTADLDRQLVAAVKLHNEMLVRALLDAGADPNARHVNEPVLSCAAAEGGVALIDILLTAGADPNATNGDGYPPLADAIERGNLAAAERLIRGGAQVNFQKRPDESLTILFAAARADLRDNDARRTEFLLQRGADPARPMTINGFEDMRLRDYLDEIIGVKRPAAQKIAAALDAHRDGRLSVVQNRRIGENLDAFQARARRDKPKFKVRK